MSDIASRVKAIIVDKLGVDESEVVAEASFTNDLGADSLDTVELIMEFEKNLISKFRTIKLKTLLQLVKLSLTSRRLRNNKPNITWFLNQSHVVLFILRNGPKN